MSHERLTLWWLQCVAQRDLANADLGLARSGKRSDTVVTGITHGKSNDFANECQHFVFKKWSSQDASAKVPVTSIFMRRGVESSGIIHAETVAPQAVDV
jgi:hypothetical protein